MNFIKKIVIPCMVLFLCGLGMFYFFKPYAISETMQARQVIDHVYDGINGFSLSQEDSDKMKELGAASVYGEILYDSLEIVLDSLEINDKDIFYDFGAGVGKAVMQVALNTNAKRVVGLELSADRIDRAIQAKERLTALGYKKPAERLIFEEKDFLETSVNDATIVYLCSTCFPDSMMEKIIDKIISLEQEVRIISLRRIDNPTVLLKNEYKLPMSWSEGSPVYVYQTVKGLNT